MHDWRSYTEFTAVGYDFSMLKDSGGSVSKKQNDAHVLNFQEPGLRYSL
jgi:hypothetical protein